ncbi:MAG: PilN domain-containing protein [Armatimonadota bacterium]
MPSINMIAARRAEQNKLEERVRIAMLCVIGSIIIALAILSFMTARVYSTNRAITSVDEQLAQVQPVVDKIENYENEISKLMPKLSLLQDSRKQTMVWYGILQDLSRSMADKTWITGLSTATKVLPATGDTPSRSATSVSLKGTTISQSMVGETMLKLNQSSEFDQIDLDFTQKSSAQGVDLLDFAISAMIKPQNKEKEGASGNAGN